MTTFVHDGSGTLIDTYADMATAEAAIDAGTTAGTALKISTDGPETPYFYVSATAGMSAQAAVDAADAGDAIKLSAGTHVQSGELTVNEEVTITGAGEGATTIQAAATSYGIHITADNVTMSDLSVDASALMGSGRYGIKVSPGGASTAALTNLTLQDLTVTGAPRSEIDLNGVDNSSLIRVTADGGTGGSGGVGIALSDSTGITLEDITTMNNDWGSVGVYSAGRSYEPGTNDITFLGTYSHGEAIGIYADEEINSSTSMRTVVENLNMSAIYPDTVYKVQNDTHRDGSDGRGEDFTFFFGDEAQAVAFALGLVDGAISSTITFDDSTADVDAERGTTFIVAEGMSIQAAVEAASDGDTIVVGAGTFNENIVIDKSVTLLGAQSGVAATDGARSGGESVIDGSETFGITVLADDVTVDGFEITGFGRDAINVRTLENGGVGDGATRSGVELKNNWLHSEDASGQRNGVVVGEFSGDPARSVEDGEVTGLIISDNYIDIESSGGRGLAFTNHFDFMTFTNTVIENNTVESGSAAIFAGASTDTFRFENADISANQFESGSINAYNFFNSTFDGNTFNDIVVIGVDGSTVSNNIFNVADYYGLGLWGTEYGTNFSQNSDISGNTFNYNQATVGSPYIAGVALRDGVDVASLDFDGNTFNDGGFNSGLAASDVIIRGGSTDDMISAADLTDTAGDPISVSVRIEGNDGEDELVGGSLADTLIGGEDNDDMTGGGGDDSLMGGDDTDTANFSGNAADYSVSVAGGVITVTDNRAGSPDGTDTLTDVELLRFADGLLVADGMSLAAVVAAAEDGDTINIAAGDFTLTSQLVIDKDLTIIGAGQGNTNILAGFDTGSGGDPRGLILVTQDTDLDVSALTIDGDGHEVYQAVRHKGIGSFDDVGFNDIQFDPYNGTAIAAFVGSGGGTGAVDVSNSDFTNIGRIGVLYYGDGTTGTFDNNTYQGKGAGDHIDYVLDIGAGAVVDVTNNTVSDMRGVASSDGSTSAGFIVTTFFGAGSAATFSGNTISNSTTGIFVGYDEHDTSNATIGADNTIDNTDTGLRVVGNGTVSGVMNLAGDSADVNWAGGNAANAVSGAALDDVLDGGAGADVINGGDGDDLIVSSAGNDTIDGGAGTDTYDFAAAGSNGGVVDLGNGYSFSGAPFNDTLSNIENVKGSDGNDIIIGGAGDNVFFASDGTDQVKGAGGTDTYDASDATAGVDIDLDAGTVSGAHNGTLTEIENAVGGSGNDDLTGSGGVNRLSGGGGDDMLTGGGGDDMLIGGEGVDTAVFSGDAGDATIDADGGSVTGADGTDSIDDIEILQFASGGNVLLVGNGGFDTIQEAVTAATAGDTILVADGTYDAVTIDRSVTLLAVNDGGATINGAGVNQGAAIRIDAGVDDVVIGGAGQGFVINGTTGDLAAIYAVGNNDNITVSHNTIDGGVGNAFLSGGDSGFGLMNSTITENTMTSAGSAQTIYNNGSFISVTSSGNTFSNNTLSGDNLLMGIEGTAGTISGNTFNGAPGYAGLEVFGAGNAISGNHFNLDTGSTAFVDGSSNYDEAAVARDNDTDLRYIVQVDDRIEVHATEGAAATAATTPVPSGLIFDTQENRFVVLDDMSLELATDTATGAESVFFNAATIDLSYATGPVSIDIAGATASGTGLPDIALGANTVNGIGTAEADTLTGDTRDNALTGGAGDDTFVGSLGDDMITGGSGTNTLTYTGVVSSIFANLQNGSAFGSGIGADSFTGIQNLTTGSGADVLFGSSGDNVINGGGGADNIMGGAGDDNIAGGTGIDTMDGGDGVDTVDFTHSSANASFDLGTGVADFGGGQVESFTNFENLLAGSGDNTITGTAGNNMLDGGRGADNIMGGAGDDNIAGGFGIDTMDGGDGVDTVDFTHSSANASFDLGTGVADFGGGQVESFTNFENLLAGSGDNTITGTAGANMLDGGAGNDDIMGGGGADNIMGGAGDDFIAGGFGIDTMDGGDGVDTVDFTHTSANTRFDLGTGVATFNDGVFGIQVESFTNFENVLAGSGDNIITGSSDDNQLTGGAGDDTFVFVDGFGNDTITDFSSGDAEKIDLAGVTGITDFTDLLTHLTDAGGGSTLITDGSDTILLEGVDINDIGVGELYSADDFTFLF